MALSNIVREPRREITEQIIGTVAVGLYLLADYLLARLIVSYDREPVLAELILLMMVIGVGGLGVILFLIFTTHWIGEGICAGLRNIGLDPRPRQRY